MVMVSCCNHTRKHKSCKRQTLKIAKNKRIVFKKQKDYELCKSYLEKYV